ncbi:MULTISPECIES: hypothetical protein [unclassified Nitrosospira]|uniref:hypothetical protein n=1 Tax=unclassified Nitrosospira TaxID=2609267 RepID=UPI0015E69D2D|nr:MULTISPECIES: hypothetical protein [unclassified Nitrosospira]WON74347.1 hypothetical protein R5L00_02310 [Nitrosospira sp. Is2]
MLANLFQARAQPPKLFLVQETSETSEVEMERRLTSIKTALFLLTSSLVLPMIYYLIG